ncbi:hypothetical protein JUNP586_1841 [Acinetobacter baumannii]
MRKANSFYWEFCQALKLWWQRKRVSRLGNTQAHPKVSHSRPTATGGDEKLTHKTIPQKE